MGFNATRKYRDSKWSDIVLLVVGVVILAGLLLWALGIL